MTDTPPAVITPRKRCPECGHENRLGAKVCTQCGHIFLSMKSRGQKWCPRCGTVNKLEAKVCVNCGHRFRTVFRAPSAPPLPKEDPITQPDPPAVELPPTFEGTRPPLLPKSKPTPPQPQATPNLLDGEPAPDLTDFDFDQLRHPPKKG